MQPSAPQSSAPRLMPDVSRTNNEDIRFGSNHRTNELGSGGSEHRGNLLRVTELVAATGHARTAARARSEHEVIRAVVSLAHHGGGSTWALLNRRAGLIGSSLRAL
jgi:hypothetical protein